MLRNKLAELVVVAPKLRVARVARSGVRALRRRRPRALPPPPLTTLPPVLGAAAGLAQASPLQRRHHGAYWRVLVSPDVGTRPSRATLALTMTMNSTNSA